ncbi:hypothetical protein [Halobacterium wangiae]|uniref:hypothetical protein n=1 Tax=Halobacterium wangiae TaxID=2902623 RepID=UPI001E63A10C|nr:hypothetical protein [Halobacterium wangiae]
MKRRHIARFLEFLVIGILMGVIEDLLAIGLTTDEPFTLEMVVVVVLVAIPFAAIAELVVDHEEIEPFQYILRRLKIGEESPPNQQ